MAVDGYMWFQDYNKGFLPSESQVDIDKLKTSSEPLYKTFFTEAASKASKDNPTLFEIEDFSFDVEQTLNIGSQSTGAGAGKITFNPFSITRKIDRSSPTLLKKACSGTPFMQVALGLRKSSGGDQTGQFFLVFFFKLVAVKTISWSYDDESPKETVTFEYGGLQVHYTQQKPDGSMMGALAGGWNRVKNIRDTDTTESSLIK